MLKKTETELRGSASRRRSFLRIALVLLALFPAIHIMAPSPVGNAQTLVEPEESQQPRPVEFWATAYCDEGTTKSGVPAAPGIVAADPTVLPLGSVICVQKAGYDGLYQVMDTGRLVRGRTIDIYIPSLRLATEFGRRRVRVTVLRHGFPQ
jgi:3D (Asp-Asp-Asp) domain-containing protein